MEKKPAKKLKRYGEYPPDSEYGPDGHYSSGVTNPAMLVRLGMILTSWADLEERMIEFLESLLGGGNAPARQIFRTLRANAARIQIMTALLQRGKINADKSDVFDEIISEFAALNKMRNSYFHGLWSTHESGKVFLKEPPDDDLDYGPSSNEVSQTDLDSFATRMNALSSRIALSHEVQSARGKLSPRSLALLARRTPSEKK